MKQIGFVEAFSKVTPIDWAKTLVPLFICVYGFHVLLRWSIQLKNIKNANTRVNNWIVYWYAISGSVHLYIELFFVFFRRTWIKPGMDLFGAADLRYSDPLEAGTAAVELITYIFIFVSVSLCLTILYM